MSYAFSEVREHQISIIREAASYGVDGINFNWARGAPFMMYERPLIEVFKNRYSQDPTQIDDEDDRWLNLKGETMTGFMREAKEAVTDESRKTGKEITMSVIVLGTEKLNRFHGIDIKNWIDEGLINILGVYPVRAGDPDEWMELDYFLNITRNTPVKLYPIIRTPRMTSDEYRKRAKELYNKGVTGILLWDIQERQRINGQWNTLKRLGHREELDGQTAVEESPVFRLRMLDGYTIPQ